jgi:hypothetical protein
MDEGAGLAALHVSGEDWEGAIYRVVAERKYYTDRALGLIEIQSEGWIL